MGHTRLVCLAGTCIESRVHKLKPVFSVTLWAELGRMDQPRFQRVRAAIERVTHLPSRELTGALREPGFTLHYAYEPDGLLTFERVAWDPDPQG